VDTGAVAAPAFGRGGELAFNSIAGTRSRLMVNPSTGSGRAVNIADDDEDVFPFRPQFVVADILYTADGKIKRRPASGGPAQVIAFTADVSFTRPAFTPKGRRFDVAAPQTVRGIVNPAISPDGSQVVFAALGDLWVMNASGGQPHRITDDPALDAAPMWSPDGKSIVFSSDRVGGMNLWIHDVAANTDRQLTKLPVAAMDASWSPDGKRVAFIDADGQAQVVDVASGAVTRLHDHLNEPGRPSWAPDGSAVVVSSLKVYSTRFREGTNQVLKIASTPGAAADRWFDPSPNKSIGMREDQGPIWSPDGKQMAAVVDGLLAVWPVAVDGSPTGPPRPITTELAGSPTWTADSRSILYQSETRLKLVDVASKRVVRTIDPRMTWTQARTAGTTTIHAGRLWDGHADTARTDVDIIVDGNRIKSVEPHRDALHNGTVIDASQETVIPGLIEIHSHLSQNFGEALGRIFLSWGITTVRNPATNTYESNEYREATESGARMGPRLLSAGEPFDGTRIYYAGGSSLDEGGEVTLRLKHAKDFGFDFIKTYVRLPDLQQKRVIEEAHAMGMPVTSHELYPAVAYGADGVEHIRGTSRRGYSPKISLLSRSYQDVIDLLAASKMTLTPTIGIQGGFRLQTLQDPSWVNDPRIQRLYPRAVWERTKQQASTPASAATIAEAERAVAPQEWTILQVAHRGGRIVAGTDAPINPYGLSLLMEMENYEHAGMTPAEVLRSATIVSAEAMGVSDQIGSIEPGKLADMAFVAGDPLKSIKNLRDTTRVMKDGRLYDRAALMSK
jgi:imidazolonepropionase-like amidohydrolase/Tol biopolymer transport system component